MQCSNCGKDIPFTGKVCPYCHADKSEDKSLSLAFWVGGLPGAVLVGILSTSLVGTFLGLLAGFVIAVVLFQNKGR
jgi:hypothetical protein